MNGYQLKVLTRFHEAAADIERALAPSDAAHKCRMRVRSPAPPESSSLTIRTSPEPGRFGESQRIPAQASFSVFSRKGKSVMSSMVTTTRPRDALLTSSCTSKTQPAFWGANPRRSISTTSDPPPTAPGSSARCRHDKKIVHPKAPVEIGAGVHLVHSPCQGLRAVDELQIELPAQERKELVWFYRCRRQVGAGDELHVAQITPVSGDRIEERLAPFAEGEDSQEKQADSAR